MNKQAKMITLSLVAAGAIGLNAVATINNGVQETKQIQTVEAGSSPVTFGRATLSPEVQLVGGREYKVEVPIDVADGYHIVDTYDPDGDGTPSGVEYVSQLRWNYDDPNDPLYNPGKALYYDSTHTGEWNKTIWLDNMSYHDPYNHDDSDPISSKKKGGPNVWGDEHGQEIISIDSHTIHNDGNELKEDNIQGAVASVADFGKQTIDWGSWEIFDKPKCAGTVPSGKIPGLPFAVGDEYANSSQDADKNDNIYTGMILSYNLVFGHYIDNDVVVYYQAEGGDDTNPLEARFSEVGPEQDIGTYTTPNTFDFLQNSTGGMFLPNELAPTVKSFSITSVDEKGNPTDGPTKFLKPKIKFTTPENVVPNITGAEQTQGHHDDPTNPDAVRTAPSHINYMYQLPSELSNTPEIGANKPAEVDAGTPWETSELSALAPILNTMSYEPDMVWGSSYESEKYFGNVQLNFVDSESDTTAHEYVYEGIMTNDKNIDTAATGYTYIDTTAIEDGGVSSGQSILGDYRLNTDLRSTNDAGKTENRWFESFASKFNTNIMEVMGFSVDDSKNLVPHEIPLGFSNPTETVEDNGNLTFTIDNEYDPENVYLLLNNDQYEMEPLTRDGEEIQTFTKTFTKEEMSHSTGKYKVDFSTNMGAYSNAEPEELEDLWFSSLNGEISDFEDFKEPWSFNDLQVEHDVKTSSVKFTLNPTSNLDELDSYFTEIKNIKLIDYNNNSQQHELTSNGDGTYSVKVDFANNPSGTYKYNFDIQYENGYETTLLENNENLDSITLQWDAKSKTITSPDGSLTITKINDGLSAGAIAGIVIGSLLIIGIIIAIIVYFVKKNKQEEFK